MKKPTAEELIAAAKETMRDARAAAHCDLVDENLSDQIDQVTEYLIDAYAEMPHLTVCRIAAAHVAGCMADGLRRDIANAVRVEMGTNNLSDGE